MRTLLRDNPTIAFGLGLPLLLVLAFVLVSAVPALLVAPPEYDVLYATGYYNDREGVQIFVRERKVQVIYRSAVQGEQPPRLWRYFAATGAVQEIPIVLPPGLTAGDARTAPADNVPATTPIAMPDLDGLVVDSSSIAPDGYAFETGSDRYSRNVFGGLFYSSRYSHRATLTRNGRSVRLPNMDEHYYRQQTRFIGWVVSP